MANGHSIKCNFCLQRKHICFKSASKTNLVHRGLRMYYTHYQYITNLFITIYVLRGYLTIKENLGFKKWILITSCNQFSWKRDPLKLFWRMSFIIIVIYCTLPSFWIKSSFVTLRWALIFFKNLILLVQAEENEPTVRIYMIS